MEITILEDLGLTQAEIKVYLSLLELGPSNAGDILRKCQLQNSVMHRALNTLLEKGLANYILEGRRRIYQGTDPENFFDFIDNKKESFAKILPELKNKQKFAKVKEKATIYRGTRGITEVYRRLRETKAKEYLSFGGGEQCEKRMGTVWWNNHHTKRIAKKLSSKQVFDETVKKFGEKLVKRPISRVRYLPAEFAQFQETVIVGNLVAVTIFTGNAYSLLIEDKLVAQGYKKHFELLWKTAKI